MYTSTWDKQKSMESMPTSCEGECDPLSWLLTLLLGKVRSHSCCTATLAMMSRDVLWLESSCEGGEANYNPPQYEMSLVYSCLQTNLTSSLIFPWCLQVTPCKLWVWSTAHSLLHPSEHIQVAGEPRGTQGPMPIAQGVVEEHAAPWWCPSSDKKVAGCCTEMDRKDYAVERK